MFHALTDLTTRGDLDAFESGAGTFTSHANIALYGEEIEEVANLSAIDGSKYEYTPFPYRPELLVAPNSKAVKELLMIKQIPHDFQLQSVGSAVPRSQIH